MAHVSTTIISNVDPFSDSFSFKEGESVDTLTQARWRSLWRNVGIAHFHAITQGTTKPQKGKNSEHSSKELYEWVDDECSWTPVLQNLGTTYLAFADNKRTTLEAPHTEATVSRSIFQMAKAYYEEIWQSLTTDEKLALFHLTKDRFIHIEHPGLEPLLRKGLIRFDPDIRLLNASFREFVRVVGERDALHDKNAEKGRSLWGSLKWPLGLGFGTILMFLIATQEELRATLPALIALLPILLQGLPELSGKNKA